MRKEKELKASYIWCISVDIVSGLYFSSTYMFMNALLIHTCTYQGKKFSNMVVWSYENLIGSANNIDLISVTIWRMMTQKRKRRTKK